MVCVSAMRKALTYLKKNDKTLAGVIGKAGKCSLVPSEKFSPYQSLIKAITYQQLHGKAAATIHRRFLEIFPTKRHPKPEEILKVPLARLRKAGLSQAKAIGIREVCQKTLEGVVPTSKKILELSDDEIIERLTTIRGVGVWTVQMLLIFQMGRHDVLPSADFGVRKGFSLAYKRPMPTPKELIAFGERWKPYRSIAAWYLWRAVDLAKTAPVKVKK